MSVARFWVDSGERVNASFSYAREPLPMAGKFFGAVLLVAAL